MNKVILLHHVYQLGEEEEVKFIGVFTSMEKAEAAIKILRTQPGFQDFPDCFEVNEHILDEYSWQEGFITVWD